MHHALCLSPLTSDLQPFPLIEDNMFYLLGIVMIVNTKELHLYRSGIGAGEDMALFVYQKGTNHRYEAHGG